VFPECEESPGCGDTVDEQGGDEGPHEYLVPDIHARGQGLGHTHHFKITVIFLSSWLTLFCVNVGHNSTSIKLVLSSYKIIDLLLFSG